MALTATQLATLKAAIQADATAAAYWTAGQTSPLVEYLNSPPATEPTLLWRENVTARELFHALYGPDVLSLSAQQLAILQLAGIAGSVDFSSINIESGLGQLFGPLSTTAANIAKLAVRPATRFEALYASTQGKASITAVYGHSVDIPTIQQAMAT